jgi:hypothetical protein
MMQRFPFRSRVLIVATLLATLSVIAVTTEATLASRSGCRTDPVVLLTDGTTIEMEAAIGVPVAEVQSVIYTLHAPEGSRVLSIVYTGGLLGVREKVVFYDDAPPGVYTSDTFVSTAGRASVEAYTRVITLLGLDAGTASGRDHQHLLVELEP